MGAELLHFSQCPTLVCNGGKTVVYMGSCIQREEGDEMKGPFVLLGTLERFRQTQVACSRIREKALDQAE